MENHDNYVKSLIKIVSGLDRQGPGDNNFSTFIIEQIPELPLDPRIADLGCGSGAGALLLAEKYHSKVKAVDFLHELLDQLLAQARHQGLEEFIEIIECDIGKLDWHAGTIDLIWSEGAAYNLTFKGALKKWRPLLVVGGIAVISEMNYFSEKVSKPVTKCIKKIYPDIKTEPENVELINSSGYEILGAHRLPSNAWWDNYYDPLRAKISAIESSGDRVMQEVINEFIEEMNIFKEYEKFYGYTYYIMRAV